MAFDLASAKPVSGGFDISTAKPVQESATPPPQEKRSVMDAFIQSQSPASLTGAVETVSDAFTGGDRNTPEMDSMQEIGAAPELNALSGPAFKGSLGLLSTGDPSELKSILAKQFNSNVSFTEDHKGNVIVNLPSGQYALNKPGLSGQDIIRGAFDAVAFTPAGAARTVPGAIAKAAITEAGIEGVESSVGGKFSPTDVAISGGIGGVGKSLEKAIGAASRASKGSPDNEIVSAGRDAGIPVLTSDAIPPKTFAGKIAQQTGEKIPVAGTGAMREGQQELRARAVDEVARKYGEFSYPVIVKSLKTQKDKVKKAAGSVLESVGEQLDAAGEIHLTNTRPAIKAATEALSKKGVIKSSQAIDDLGVLVKSIDEAPQTFSSLKENRTAFREIVKGADKADRSQLTSRAKALLQRVEVAMKQDMDAAAKANLTPREYGKWLKANKVYAQEAEKLTKSRLKNVLDKGDVTPESVQTMLFSKKPSEVGSLYQSMGPTGRANARSAIISKVVADLGKRSSGITPNTFASEMGKHGLQINQFFKGKEKSQLLGLIKVLNATRRAQDAAITTPTGQQLLGGGTALALFTDPATTIGAGGTLGGLSRLYESAPVRNALLRLGSIPKGSTSYEKALSEAFQALSVAAQTARGAAPAE